MIPRRSYLWFIKLQEHTKQQKRRKNWLEEKMTAGLGYAEPHPGRDQNRNRV